MKIKLQGGTGDAPSPPPCTSLMSHVSMLHVSLRILLILLFSFKIPPSCTCRCWNDTTFVTFYPLRGLNVAFFWSLVAMLKINLRGIMGGGGV